MADQVCTMKFHHSGNRLKFLGKVPCVIYLSNNVMPNVEKSTLMPNYFHVFIKKKMSVYDQSQPSMDDWYQKSSWSNSLQLFWCHFMIPASINLAFKAMVRLHSTWWYILYIFLDSKSFRELWKCKLKLILLETYK